MPLQTKNKQDAMKKLVMVLAVGMIFIMAAPITFAQEAPSTLEAYVHVALYDVSTGKLVGGSIVVNVIRETEYICEIYADQQYRYELRFDERLVSNAIGNNFKEIRVIHTVYDRTNPAPVFLTIPLPLPQNGVGRYLRLDQFTGSLKYTLHITTLPNRMSLERYRMEFRLTDTINCKALDKK